MSFSERREGLTSLHLVAHPFGEGAAATVHRHKIAFVLNLHLIFTRSRQTFGHHSASHGGIDARPGPQAEGDAILVGSGIVVAHHYPLAGVCIR